MESTPHDITVLFFAQARLAAGTARACLAVPLSGWNQEELWQALLGRWPDLAALRSFSRLALNQCFATSGQRVMPGDEVVVMPPVSGG